MIFEAKLSNLHKMLKHIDKIANNVGFSDKDLHKIQLASEEALVNVISYAYPPNSQGRVDVKCEFRIKRYLTIIIKDNGLIFNPLDHCKVDVNAPLEKRKIGGLGIFFFLKAMDELEYHREGDFNFLKMTKRVSNK
jgi:serine/threonine-protein kinase RsbW